MAGFLGYPCKGTKPSGTHQSLQGKKIQELQSTMQQLEDEKNVLENRMQKLEMEYQALPEDTDLRAAWKMLVQEQHRYEIKEDGM